VLDRRIRDIERLVDSGRYAILSLDLFDTVIWRMVPEPRDVFFLVAGRLRERGWTRASSSPESFVKERAGAEERARLRQPSREVTLADIYDEFPRGYLDGALPRQVAELEFEIERGLVRVNPDMEAVIARARSRGLPVAFVSDSYFTPEQIRELVGVEPDHLLVSSAERVSKYQGLHRLLIERTGIEPARVLHVGNDYQADVEGPAAFGLDRYWFRVWPEAYEDLPKRELPSTLSDRAAVLGGDDAGLTTLRSRAMASATDQYERWGAGILGPVVAGFADWVTGRCRELGIGTVLCLMREGRVLKRVLDDLGSGLDARELFVSRYAARKAAILDGTEEELLRFVLRPSPRKRGVILRQLGLESGDAGAGDPDERLAPKALRALIRRIAGDPALRKKVLGDAARARAGLLAHLRKVLGHAPAGPVAVMDLGYKGTIQECLHRILEREDPRLTTHGFYLVTGGEVHETQATGAAVEGWLAENGQPIAVAHTFMRSPEIVEQSLMAPCGSTMGYTESGEPVLGENPIDDVQGARIEAVQRGLRAWARAWREHKETHGITGTERFKDFYRNICIASVARPLPVELTLFGDWRHDENFGSGRTRGLAEAEGLTSWELDHVSPHQLASLPMSRLHWPFGLAHRLGPVMGEAVTHIFLRTAEPSVFDSGHPSQVMAVYWDSGGGFNRDQAKVIPYRLNHRGRVWQRITLRRDAGGRTASRLAFSIGTPGQIVQLTGVAVAEASGGRTEAPRRLPHHAIERHGYRPLHANLYLVERDPAVFVVPVEGGGAERIDVDVFFGLIPVAEPAAAVEPPAPAEAVVLQEG
jgi:FMN phosphatase YigB (HAD superfamily)